MSTLSEHIKELIESSGSSGRNLRATEQWLKNLSTSSPVNEELRLEEIDLEANWPSIKTSFSGINSEETSINVGFNTLEDILSNISDQKNIPQIRSLLLSEESNEEIAAKLAELIDLRNIHLIPNILELRTQLHRNLIEHIKTHGDLADLNQSNGITKDKKSVLHTSRESIVESSRHRMEEVLRANANRPLYTNNAPLTSEVLPNVYTSQANQGSVISHLGSKYLLPVNTARSEDDICIEVTVPPAKSVPPKESERLIAISELEDLAKGSFPGYSTLNRVQSIVFPTAYGTNENLLVAAPTGAGKTDIAILAILRIINQYRSHLKTTTTSIASSIRRNEFKIIYVAPMKALAAEVVHKFSKRLKWLAIEVRELTGDMQLTRSEIASTQVIVTTPEKWDVVTRKPVGEGELASQVKLLIIDEVHLLNEERGAVIETIVARTLRQVEATQSLIRIVGLSATLPNYVDVADFLRVSRTAGLFYFDSSFRPVPLEQHFLGVKGKPGSPQSRKNLDEITFKKVSSLVTEGHQVMVFVHARKETVKSAMALKEAAFSEGTIDDFICDDHPNYYSYRRDVGTSKNKELKQLFDHGFGIHHAGMLRSDRNLVEKLFREKAIKVLCCTATLAWGVNLPAHAVLIKGTQVYDSTKGKFVDLSVLDVLQIFGRAGRPGLETSGEGYICTTEDKLTHYLDAVTTQNPIESKFVEGMIDALNAEISLGTVSNITEGVQWIGYTYLFVRMRKNPFVYGMPHGETEEDPHLGKRRYELMLAKARQLSSAQMILFDEESGSLNSTELGRIAAKYYIRSASVEIYNKLFRHGMGEADVLAMLSMSAEFDQIQLRENEVEELKTFLDNEDIVPCQVQGGTDTSQGKVNILFQAYISRVYPEDFALVSDMAYVAQNGSRIIRALLEIAISKKWADVSAVLMTISKAVEKRIWPFDHPLIQYENRLRQDVLYNLKRWADEYSVSELAEKNALEVGHLIHMNEKHGAALLNVAREFPTVNIEYRLQPLTSNYLQVIVRVEAVFDWGSRPANSSEPFWLWLEDNDGLNIYQLHHLLFYKQSKSIEVEYAVPIVAEEIPLLVNIRFTSDRWLGSDIEVEIPLEKLIMPASLNSHTVPIHLPFLSVNSLQVLRAQKVSTEIVSELNSIQTQSFWSLINTSQNFLLCAPAGSGKSTLGEMVALKSINDCVAGQWILIVGPTSACTLRLCKSLRKFTISMDFSIEHLTSTNHSFPATKRLIICASAKILLAAMTERKWSDHLSRLRLVVCDDLQQLTDEYELGLSLLLHSTHTFPIRFVGFSASLSEPSDLADWLRVPPPQMYSFQPKHREQDLHISVQPFSIPYSAALFKVLAKQAHNAIRSNTIGDSCILFIPSRHLCKSIVSYLLTQCAIDSEMQGYFPNQHTVEELEPFLSSLRDVTLADCLAQGIGFVHEGMDKNDRKLVLKLFSEKLIPVILVTREYCWSLSCRAGLVVIMGTQYVRNFNQEEERKVKDYSWTELNRMQSCATRHGSSGQLHIFCQTDSRERISYFLNEGLPLESELHSTTALGQLITRNRNIKQTAMDILSWTFLAKRLSNNPMYYAVLRGAPDETLSCIVDRFDSDQQTL